MRDRYDTMPWLRHYSISVGPHLELDVQSSLAHFRRSVSRSPEAPCLMYFDAAYDYRTVDEMSDALAVALAERGIGRGERVALLTQNIPQFVLGVLATWKLGAIYVPLSPMFKATEVEYHLNDSGAKAIIAGETLYRDEVTRIRDNTDLRAVITTSDLDFLGDVPPPRALASVERYRAPGTEDLCALLERYRGREPEWFDPAGSDVAILSYTSGTTGRPKGAMNTHLNIANNSEVWRVWADIDESDVVAALAPLFHITGPPGITGVAFTRALPIVLTHRFDAATVMASIERHRCTFTLASITAFLALMSCPDIHTRDLSSFRKVFSGGAPVAPATVAQWRQLTGSYIHNCFGLTETNSPTIMVPCGTDAPVDEASGALSIGVPTPGTGVRVVNPETGEDVVPGEEGEFWIRGPGVVPGYWERPEATAEVMVDGYFRTGDIGKRDDEGWFYAIDRSKDMIIASGFKVWPREVEDLLYQHPDVREAAVIGVPDDYRGENVKAFISLRDGASVTGAEIIDFCRQRIAAYKYPRQVEIVREVPKTATGKFLRRELRAREAVKTSENESEQVSSEITRPAGTRPPEYAAVVTGLELGPAKLRATEHLVRAYSFAQDDYNPWYSGRSPFGGPIVPPGVLVNELLLIYYYQYRQADCAAIHTHERLRLHGPAFPGEEITVTGRYVDKFVKRGKGYVVIESEARAADGRLLLSHRGTEIMDGRSVAVGGSGARPVEPVDSEVPVLGKRPRPDQVAVFSNIGKQQKNIHNDIDFARVAGLRAPVVQGMQQACYLIELGTAFFGATMLTSGQLDLRFVAPLYLGTDVVSGGTVIRHDARRATLDCWVRDQSGRASTVGTVSAEYETDRAVAEGTATMGERES